MNAARSAMISRDVQHPITADIIENVSLHFRRGVGVECSDRTPQCVRFHPALRWDIRQLKRHAFFGNM
jgi:hypothetical protein